MSHEYAYDTKGNMSAFLLLTITLPLFLFLVTRRSPKTCDCIHHRLKKKKSNLKYIIPLSVVVVALIYRVLTAKFEAPKSPYTTLGLDDTASKQDVRKAYRRLVRKYDPDFNKNDEECTAILYDINLAYNQITQGIKIKNTVLEEVVAIPQFIVDRKYCLMVFYLTLLLLFVYGGIKLWRRSVKCNVHGIDYGTVELFYKKIDDLIARDSDCITRNIINLMGESVEFKTMKGKINKWVQIELDAAQKIENELKKNETPSVREEKAKDLKSKISLDQIKKKSQKKAHIMAYKKSPNKDPVSKFLKTQIEHKYAYPLREGSSGFYILMDHLFRTKVFTVTDTNKVADKALGMISVLKRIAVAKNLHEILNSLFMVQRMITQAVFEPAYWSLQYPSVVFEDVFLKKKKTLDESIALPHIKITKMMSYVDISESNSDEDTEEGQKSTEKKALKNTLITVKAIIERDLKNNSLRDETFFVKTKGEVDLDIINAMGKSRKTIVHSPFIDKESTLIWEAVFIFNDEIKRTFSFSDFDGEKEVIFEMDSEKGKLELEIKNGQYFGCDVKSELMIENQ